LDRFTKVFKVGGCSVWRAATFEVSMWSALCVRACVANPGRITAAFSQRSPSARTSFSSTSCLTRCWCVARRALLQVDAR
jgi:hypothetical protein